MQAPGMGPMLPFCDKLGGRVMDARRRLAAVSAKPQRPMRNSPPN